MLSTYTGVKATWEQTSTEIMTTHYLILSAAQGNYPAEHFALRHTETIPKVQRSWTCIGPEQKPCCCSPIMPGLKMIHTGTHLSSLAQALCHANCMYRFQVKAALSSYLLQSLGNVNWHLSKTCTNTTTLFQVLSMQDCASLIYLAQIHHHTRLLGEHKTPKSKNVTEVD